MDIDVAQFTQYCVMCGQTAFNQYSDILIFHQGNNPPPRHLTQPPPDYAPEAPGQPQGVRSHYVASVN